MIFWLYSGSPISGVYPAGKQFSFVLDQPVDITPGSFLIWDHRPGFAMLAKIRRRRQIPKSHNWKYDAYDNIEIRVSINGVLNSAGMPTDTRHQIMPVRLPAERSDHIKRILIRGNRALSEGYFTSKVDEEASDVSIQAFDSMRFALSLLGWKPSDIPEGIEDQVIWKDVEDLSHRSEFHERMGATSDGRLFFRHKQKILYLHVVNRHKLERCMGVDLIYNFTDEKRLIFVQYKCPQPGKQKYYPNSDASGKSELVRMNSIPGVAACSNRITFREQPRLCSCPIFIRLIERNVRVGNTVPNGAYFPLCIWEHLIASHTGITPATEPHMTGQHFHDFVRMRLIGTSHPQSQVISDWIVDQTADERMKLVFEETSRES